VTHPLQSWTDEERVNPALVRGRLLAELGLTSSTPAELVGCWDEALLRGIPAETLQELTLKTDNALAATAWVTHFGWPSTLGNPPAVDDNSEARTFLYAWEKAKLPAPPLPDLLRKILEHDGARVLAAFRDTDPEVGLPESLPMPDLWHEMAKTGPWWMSALWHGAEQCAELAWPGEVSKSSPAELTEALMAVLASQLPLAISGEEEEKSSRPHPVTPPMASLSPEAAAKWAARFLELGADPHQLLAMDRGIDEALYVEAASSWAPRSAGYSMDEAMYAPAHLLLHLMVWSERLDGRFDKVCNAVKPFVDATRIPNDAWWRDAVSFVLTTNTRIFETIPNRVPYHPDSVSSASARDPAESPWVGKSAMEWLSGSLPVWSNDEALEKGWHPGLSLMIRGLSGIHAPTADEFVGRIVGCMKSNAIHPLPWERLTWEIREIRSQRIGSDLGIAPLKDDGVLTWDNHPVWGNEGLLHALTPSLDGSVQEAWSAFVTEGQNRAGQLPLRNSKVYFGGQGKADGEITTALQEGQQLAWSTFLASPPVVRTSPVKVRL
jgi:hypothetical protein